MDWYSELMSGQFTMSVQMLATGVIYGIYLKQRRNFVWRVFLGCLIYLLLFFMLPEIYTQSGFPLPPAFIYVMFTVLSCFLFDISWNMQFFFVLSTVVTQHLAVAIQDCLRALFAVSESGFCWNFLSVFSFIAVLPACFLLFGKNVKYIADVRMRPLKLLASSFAIFLVVYILRVYSLFQLTDLGDGIGLTLVINLYSVMGSLGALVVLYLIKRGDALEEENRLIEQVNAERENQLRYMRETIDLVNIKCHDIKHYVNLLRTKKADASEEMLTELERAATVYDSFARTGNEMLDTVLTEKAVYCSGRLIRFNYMVDSKNLSFLQPADICSLFGNILENAIEAEQREPPEYRMISLQVFHKSGYLCIHAENYCSTQLVFENGIPVTVKSDKKFHGFGIKSIQYIAQKYDGNMTITMRGNMFCLDVLLPLSETDANDSTTNQ